MPCEVFCFVCCLDGLLYVSMRHMFLLEKYHVLDVGTSMPCCLLALLVNIFVYTGLSLLYSALVSQLQMSQSSGQTMANWRSQVRYNSKDRRTHTHTPEWCALQSYIFPGWFQIQKTTRDSYISKLFTALLFVSLFFQATSVSYHQLFTKIMGPTTGHRGNGSTGHHEVSTSLKTSSHRGRYGIWQVQLERGKVYGFEYAAWLLSKVNNG